MLVLVFSRLKIQIKPVGRPNDSKDSNTQIIFNPWSVMHKEICIPVRKLCMTTMRFCVGWLPWRHARRLRNELCVCRCQERRRIAFEVFKLRGAWSDRDTNDIFAHCSLVFYFIDFKFSNFACPSELHPLIWFFCKNSFRKKKNPKTHPKRLSSQHLHSFVNHAETWYSAFRNFFPKLWFKKIDFWSDWAQIFRKDSLCHPPAPNFFFGGVIFKITAEFRFFSLFPWKRSKYNSFFTNFVWL